METSPLDDNRSAISPKLEDERWQFLEDIDLEELSSVLKDYIDKVGGLSRAAPRLRGYRS